MPSMFVKKIRIKRFSSAVFKLENPNQKEKNAKKICSLFSCWAQVCKCVEECIAATFVALLKSSYVINSNSNINTNKITQTNL